MTDEFELFQKYMDHPDTNRRVFEGLVDDMMSDPATTAINKAINFIMSNPDGTELR